MISTATLEGPWEIIYFLQGYDEEEKKQDVVPDMENICDVTGYNKVINMDRVFLFYKIFFYFLTHDNIKHFNYLETWPSN